MYINMHIYVYSTFLKYLQAKSYKYVDLCRSVFLKLRKYVVFIPFIILITLLANRKPFMYTFTFGRFPFSNYCTIRNTKVGVDWHISL